MTTTPKGRGSENDESHGIGFSPGGLRTDKDRGNDDVVRLVSLYQKDNLVGKKQKEGRWKKIPDNSRAYNIPLEDSQYIYVN